MLVGKKIHHLHGEESEHRGQYHDEGDTDGGSHADGAADIGKILLAPILADEDAKATLDTEHDAQKQEHRYVGGGDGGHGGIAQLADHEGVDEAEGEGDEIL